MKCYFLWWTSHKVSSPLRKQELHKLWKIWRKSAELRLRVKLNGSIRCTMSTRFLIIKQRLLISPLLRSKKPVETPLITKNPRRSSKTQLLPKNCSNLDFKRRKLKDSWPTCRKWRSKLLLHKRRRAWSISQEPGCYTWLNLEWATIGSTMLTG